MSTKQNEWVVIFIRNGSALSESYNEKPCFRQLQTYAHISSKRGERDLLWVVSGHSFYYPLRSDGDLDKLLAMGVLEEKKWIINAYLPFDHRLNPGNYESDKATLPQDLALCREAPIYRSTRVHNYRRALKQ